MFSSFLNVFVNPPLKRPHSRYAAMATVSEGPDSAVETGAARGTVPVKFPEFPGTPAVERRLYSPEWCSKIEVWGGSGAPDTPRDTSARFLPHERTLRRHTGHRVSVAVETQQMSALCSSAHIWIKGRVGDAEGQEARRAPAGPS